MNESAAGASREGDERRADAVAGADSAPVELPVDTPIWGRFFMVAPLVIVGTRDATGSDDLAPKHMAMPLGWENRFCFACSPDHTTQQNAIASGEFAVSFPRPGQIVDSSLAAGPRADDGSKPTLEAIPTREAQRVSAPLVQAAYLWLECEVERIVEGFGRNTLIVGAIVAAAADGSVLRDEDRDDSELIRATPLLAYLAPGRFAEVGESYSFPFHADFRL